MGRLGLHVSTDALESARGHASLADPDARDAFIQTLRASIGVAGQRVDARDGLYLAAAIPTPLVWGRRDAIIAPSVRRPRQVRLRASGHRGWRRHERLSA